MLKAGEKAAEETGKKAVDQSLEWAKSLWTKLKPEVEAKPAALEAAQDVVHAREDEDLQATLRVQLKKLLTEDQSLAEEVSRWLEQGKAAGNIVTVSSERNIAIGSDAKGLRRRRWLITAQGSSLREPWVNFRKSLLP